MNASIHLPHSFAFSAFLMEISFSTVGFEKNLRMHKSGIKLNIQISNDTSRKLGSITVTTEDTLFYHKISIDQSLNYNQNSS